MAGPFPALLLGATYHRANGPFAETQAASLHPDADTVARLDDRLSHLELGVVAHYYMDSELQGVLQALKKTPVHISDSLVMADRAVDMAKAGAKGIIVLGVDFMAENARALLDDQGFSHIPVYRCATTAIGCSLAEAADSDAYLSYLTRASQSTSPAIHVVYINTSLLAKAKANALVPTITCTSSNVVQTILQAFAQVPDLEVWFGPDTYMGRNLQEMFAAYRDLSLAEVQALHPAHTPETIANALSRLHIFEQGNCIVHHHFGGEITQRVASQYQDAYLAAHLEVPGELFRLALAAAQAGRGVVGSTSNILDFIVKTTTNAPKDLDKPLRFVLGTEAGMTAAILQRLRRVLTQPEHANTQVELIFPVAQEAVTFTGDASLPVIPGVPAQEGCSTAGGCATCPYMKLNSLDRLEDLINVIGNNRTSASELSSYYPKLPAQGNQEILTRATSTILAMRDFQATGQIPPRITSRLSGTPTL